MKKLITPFFILFAALFSYNIYAATIENNQAIFNLSTSTGNYLKYEIDVPLNAEQFSVSIESGSGDADLYVRAGANPTVSSYDCRPYLDGNSESCNFSSPAGKTYYINIRAYSTFAGVTLSASYKLPESLPNDETLVNGQPVSNLSGASNSTQVFQINVPENSSDLKINMSGGSGDADLYVKSGSTPSTSNFDCRPYLNGNDEQCTFSDPNAGTYYILIRGYSNFSGVKLSASYNASENSGGATWDGFNNYYSNVIGKSGSALLNALNEAAARNHGRMTYSEVWESLKYTDEDPNNTDNVILIYTGRSQAKSFSASGNNDPDAWNREHAWPKSRGFPSAGDWGYTDIHHLRPADASVNTARSNKDYDNGGSAIGEAPGNYTDSDSFEPRNAVKGDLARMMFYMDIRYNGSDSTGTDDLKLVSYTGTNGALLGDVCTLIEWHNQDPVDGFEIERHTRIVEEQGNRNPFVDYPQWANEIWGSDCN